MLGTCHHRCRGVLVKYRVLIVASFSVLAVSPLAAATEPSVDISPVVAGQGVADPLPEAPAPRISDPVFDAELEDLEFIARERGISAEEAAARLSWQDNFSLAMDQVREMVPEAFAAAEIVDAGHARVAFVMPVPAAATAPIEEFRSLFPGITVEQSTDAAVSERDLESAMEAVYYAVFDDLDVLDATTVFEPETSTLVTRAVVAGVDPEARIAQLQAAAVDRLSTEVGQDVLAAVKVAVLRSELPALSADEAGTNRHKGGEVLSTCTSGFGTRQSSSTSGTRGIATAGHCPNYQIDDGYSLTLRGEYEGTHGDFQWHTGPKTENDNFFAGSSSATEVYSRDVSAKGTAEVGQTLCRNGAVTHKNCQEVRKASVCAGGLCNLVQMGAHLSTNGDSGGPVYYSGTAYGLHMGMMYDPVWPFSREVYSKAKRIDNALGVYIATN